MPNALLYNAEGVHRVNYLYIKISKLLLHINSLIIIMDIGTHDEVPKDLSPLDEELLVLKKRDEMLEKAEKEMSKIEEEE